MSRIEKALTQKKGAGEKGFIPFVMAGDPDIPTSREIVMLLAEMGADVIEVGVPFSDPIADGPIIQASSVRALETGTTIERVLKMIEDVRRRSSVPIVLFSYYNPIYRFGTGDLAKKAAAAGVDGFLVTDVIDDEADALSDRLAEQGLDLVSLVSPTTTAERSKRIAERARGFIYVVARNAPTGIGTGTGAAERLVSELRRNTDLPVAVGFGISTSKQVREVWSFADAAVVGSAIVARIAENPGDPIHPVRELIQELLPPTSLEALARQQKTGS